MVIENAEVGLWYNDSSVGRMVGSKVASGEYPSVWLRHSYETLRLYLVGDVESAIIWQALWFPSISGSDLFHVQRKAYTSSTKGPNRKFVLISPLRRYVGSEKFRCYVYFNVSIESAFCQIIATSARNFDVAWKAE